MGTKYTLFNAPQPPPHVLALPAENPENQPPASPRANKRASDTKLLRGELGIACVVATQRPERMLYDAGITPERAVLTALPLGSFVGYNRLSGGQMGGRVF